MIDSAFIAFALPALLRGALVTLEIALGASMIGIAGGTVLGVVQSSTSTTLPRLVTFFVTIIRGTPMLLQIVFMSLMLPFSAFTTAIIAIGINSSAYISQIVRSGISSVPVGQTEAARTLGLSDYECIRYIVLPQAFRVIMPALGNEIVTLIKDSSLASMIGVLELFMRGEIIKTQLYNALGVYILVGLIYLALTSCVSMLFLYLEHLYEKQHAQT